MKALCDLCGVRPAVVFQTLCSGGRTKQENLCQECFEASKPREMVDHLAAMQKGHCRFCGGQPCTDGNFFPPLFGGTGASTGFVCMSCAMEQSTYIAKLATSLRAEAASAGQDGVMRLMEEMREKVEAHMQEHAAAMKEAHCRYCDGQPCVGGIDAIMRANIPDLPQGFMCEPCSKEFQRCLMELEQKAQDETKRPVDIKDWKNPLPAMCQEIDAHLRRRGCGTDGPAA